MIHYLIVTFIDFFVGVLALTRKSNRCRISVIAYSASMGLWSLELYILSSGWDIDIIAILFHLTRWGMFFTAISFAFFTYQLVDYKSPLYRYGVLYPGLASTVLLCLTNFFLFPSQLKPVEGGFLPDRDFVFFWFTVSFTYTLFGAILYCALCYRRVSNRFRQKIILMLFSLIVIVFFSWIAIVYSARNTYLSNYIAVIINLLIVFTFLYISGNEKLANLRLAAAHFLVKLAALLFFVFIYVTLDKIALQKVDLTGQLILIFLYVLILTQCYPRFIDFVLPLTVKFLAKGSYDYEWVKMATLKALKDCSAIEDWHRILHHVLMNVVRVQGYRVLFVFPEEELDLSRVTHENTPGFITDDHPLKQHLIDSNALLLSDELPEKLGCSDLYDCYAGVLPVSFDNQLQAIVLFGKAYNSDYFSTIDLMLLQWLGDELGKVLVKIIQFGHMQGELLDAKKTLSVIGMMNQYHHDIKVPLAIIDGVVSTDMYDKEKQKQIVLEQIERGTRLITTMASILKGKITKKIEDVNVESLLSESLFVFERRFHSVITRFASVPSIRGDAVDLKILFVNVIKNSAEAFDKGRDLNLEVATDVVNDLLVISIRDTGCGMSNAILDRLWQSGMSSKKNGNGIGLQAVKRIADEHNATIEVKSEPGWGTEFLFQFRLPS